MDRLDKFAVVLVAAGCSAAVEGEPGPGAFDPEYATSPDFFTRMDGPAPSETVHGTMQIWYSTNLRPLVEAEGPFVAPVGSVAIKSQTNANGSVLINSMVKLAEGESTEGLDWYWEQRDEAGEVTNSGAIQLCVGCHEGYPDRDALAGTDIR